MIPSKFNATCNDDDGDEVDDVNAINKPTNKQTHASHSLPQEINECNYLLNTTATTAVKRVIK